MKRLCIYTTVGRGDKQVCGPYVSYALRQYKDAFDRLLVVTDIGEHHEYFSEIDSLADLLLRSNQEAIEFSLIGYRVGFNAIDIEELETYDEIIFADSTSFGPLFPLEPILENSNRLSVDFWSIGFFTNRINPTVTLKMALERAMDLSFFSVNRRIAQSAIFKQFMRSNNDFRDYNDYRIFGEGGLHAALDKAGFSWNSFIRPENTQTSAPLQFEAPEMVRSGCPIVLKSIFSIDPILADRQAIESREILEALSVSSNYDADLIWQSMLPYYPLRLIQSNLDDLQIIEAEGASTAKKNWDLGGKVAVVAHVFYVEILPEFIDLVASMPCDFDLLISTSSLQHKDLIATALKEFDSGGKIIIRVVEQNRGRDMSSLFITFRDEMLSGEYAWALRLHSKRTPQMPWQIGQSFKRHLTENLIPSRRFVQHLFDRLEKDEYRNVGVIAPPVVHIGFGTLGHSWFNNRAPLEKIAKDMNINVPLDEDTPVATYGTMYWFRPSAISPMFRYNWSWEDYNEEPNHTDGGLAHVQERLICYCAQDQGFRTVALMSTKQAARNYLKLEYKLQLLSSCFPVRDIRNQYQMAALAEWNPAKNRFSKFLEFLERGDDRFRQLTPKLWALTRPIVDVIWPILKVLEKPRRKRGRDF